jgi:nucleotide-binding universal stress UspA family protein
MRDDQGSTVIGLPREVNLSSTQKRLLIAVDGSAQSLNAVRYVAEHFAPVELKINLMYVMPAEPEIFWDLEKDAFFMKKMKSRYAQWKREARKLAQGFLDDARNVLVKANVQEEQVGVILQERKLGIARDIIEECKKGYDAVVMGRKGSSKLEDLFLGSVSHKIVERMVDTPVWVIGGNVRSNKMLLAVDDSENSRKAVDYVGTFACSAEVELGLYYVVRSFGLGFLEDFSMREEVIDDFVEEAESNVQRMFRSYKERLEKAGVALAKISTKHTLQSHSRAVEIIREAKDGDYGTIVMGRRGLSKVHEFLMGRVTDKVLNRAEGFAVWIVP